MGHIALIQEYRPKANFLGDVAYHAGLRAEDAAVLIREAAARVATAVKNKHARLELSGESILARGLCGVVAFGREMQLEICPKYVDPTNELWRSDVLFLAMLAKHGDLLQRDLVRQEPGAENDLSALTARVLLQLVSRNARRPLRLHRRASFDAFALEGDLDPSSVIFPTEDGYHQAALQFTGENSHAAVVRDALGLLCSRVRDNSLRFRLSRAARQFPTDMPAPDAVRVRLQPRLGHWQDAYDLAHLLLAGGGLSPGATDAYHGPGFIFDTWRTWERIVSQALVSGFGFSSAEQQERIPLGTSVVGGRSSVTYVKPDVVVSAGGRRFIVDAKYKGRSDIGFDGINEADLYEALAFAEATEENDVLLCYPGTPKLSGPVGTVEVAEVVTVGTRRISALCVQVNGISSRGGYQEFSRGLATGIKNHLSIT